jgi:hypothetical protein
LLFFVGFGMGKNSLFLTFPNCFGKVGKSDIPIKTRKRTFYIFFGKGGLIPLKTVFTKKEEKDKYSNIPYLGKTSKNATLYQHKIR